MDNERKPIENRLENRGWRKMEAMLDSEMPRVAPLYLRMMPYAAILILGLLSGVYFINDTAGNGTSITAVNQDGLTIYKLPNVDVFEDIAQPNSSVVASLTTEQGNINSRVDNAQLNEFTFTTGIAAPTINSVSNNPLVAAHKINNSISLNGTSIKSQSANTKENNVTAESPKRNKSIIFNDGFETENRERNIEDQLEESLSAEKTNAGSRGIHIPITLNSALTNKGSKTLVASGSLGLVTSGFNEYGVRTGLEVKKPLNEKLSVTTGVRFSRYTDNYSESYEIDASATQLQAGYLQDLSKRDVARNFYELPVYMNYNVNKTIKLKAGVAVTYNTNTAETPEVNASSLALNSTLNNTQLGLARTLYQDHHGYLGEAVLGANVTLDRVTLEAEAMKGLISNQTIDDRNILGLRLSYKFGK